MAKYFHISHGLRGCYMPVDVYVLRASTRRELKDALANEVERAKEEGGAGGSRVVVASVAAAAWREAHKPRPTYLAFVIPLAPSHNRTNFAFGVMASVATRQDYLAQEKE